MPARKRARTLTAYERLRRQILFDLWFPGQDVVVLNSQNCSKCGFVAYVPRPSEEDMRSAYSFLNKSKQEKDARHTQLDKTTYVRDEQIERVHQLVTKHVTSTKLRVLDYGGAEGRFLVPFQRQGHQCELIDYWDEQLPGIFKVGNDLIDLRDDSAYDVILCIATLEHVIDPLSIVQGFYRAMSADGVVYASVPNELCATITRFVEGEPFTHVNFYTPGSFKYLFRQAGFHILAQSPNKYGPIWILARKDAGNPPQQIIIAELDIDEYLYPRRSTVIRRIINNIV